MNAVSITKKGIIPVNTMDIEAGVDLVITAKDVFELERRLLDGIVFENFPEEKAERVLAYIMGVHDFAKMLADEITSGNMFI